MSKYNLSLSVPVFSPRDEKLKIIKAPWRAHLPATTTHDNGLPCCTRAKSIAVQMPAHFAVVVSERFQEFSVLNFQMFRALHGVARAEPNFGC